MDLGLVYMFDWDQNNDSLNGPQFDLQQAIPGTIEKQATSSRLLMIRQKPCWDCCQ